MVMGSRGRGGRSSTDGGWGEGDLRVGGGTMWGGGAKFRTLHVDNFNKHTAKILSTEKATGDCEH